MVLGSGCSLPWIWFLQQQPDWWRRPDFVEVPCNEAT